MADTSLSSRFNWEWALLESDLASTTRLVGLVFSCHVPKRGMAAFPSVGTLAGEASLSKTTVRKHLKEMVEQGWLLFDGWETYTTAGGPQKTKRYRLTVPETFVEKMQEGASVADPPSSKGGQLIGKGGQLSGQGGSAADPEQSSNRERTEGGRTPARNGKPAPKAGGNRAPSAGDCPKCKSDDTKRTPNGFWCHRCGGYVEAA